MSILVQSIESLICDGKNTTKTIEFINEKYKLSTAGQKQYSNFLILYGNVLHNIMRKHIN